MKIWKKALALTASLLLAVGSFAGCGKEEEDTTAAAKSIYVYNSKGENAEQFKEMCAAYSKESGIEVEAFSIGSGQDHMETLRAQMNTDKMPTVFSIQGLKELQEWKESGKALDLTTVDAGDFKTLADAVPAGLRLTTGKDSYGIPYNVEGYGYIVDTQMLQDLFALDSTDAIIADIKAATYDEWEAFVKATDAYIKNTTAATVKLNGTDYTFAADKAGVAANLTGVFAVMGSQKWTYGDHFINVALNAAFANPAAANAATDADIDALKGPLLAYAKALDLKTSYLAGADGAAVRGQDFIADANYGYDQTVQIFADSKAVFLKQGNWAYGNVEKANADMAARLQFLPVKMPMTDADITVDGLTVDKFNSSIPVFVPNYYAINAKASKAEQKAGMDFLVWLNTSEAGKKFVTDSFNFIPYNADPATTTLGNSLGNSILDYIKADSTLAAPYQGAPASWSGDVVGLKLLESYMNKATWTTDDYNDIADYAIAQWKELN